MMGFVGRRRMVLALSALVVTGCQSSLFAPDSSLMVANRQVVKLDLKKKTGSVTLRLKGLKAGFSTQRIASPLEMVDHLDVQLTHQDSESTWNATLTSEQLSQETIETTFEDIPAGSVTLSVTAYDVEDQVLGEGSGEGTVTAGENTAIGINVPVGFPLISNDVPQ